MDVNPPRFVISVNNSDHFHFSYVRYIENKIREVFGFEGTPIDIELRSRKSIYKNKDKDILKIESEKEQGDEKYEHNLEMVEKRKEDTKKNMNKKKFNNYAKRNDKRKNK